MSLHLMSHALCLYVQRVAISLAEKGVPFKRTYIDLANKPEWFLSISPLGKTPILVVGDQPIFEPVAILEYLEETQDIPLHPADPIARAQHRGWVEFSSSILNDIAKFYATREPKIFDDAISSLGQKFARIEERLGGGHYFEDDRFTMIDAAFGPIFGTSIPSTR
ncbi:glutathione S-transferase [Jannaschia faecimaris]|uniref:Glutathione S-transferase n=1 Tax=Jannaschia faecimaris TaxID=1244108 RepID=A0A1H3QI89_9RHOB|nr:glutathione S-transferase family protein [Jannaschia faecimaris]SDZ13020.1 glutathione S-transferase [Jannaschia faecimaris]